MKIQSLYQEARKNRIQENIDNNNFFIGQLIADSFFYKEGRKIYTSENPAHPVYLVII